MQAEIVHRFKTVLPKVREWIDHVVQDHAPQARAASSLGFLYKPKVSAFLDKSAAPASPAAAGWLPRKRKTAQKITLKATDPFMASPLWVRVLPLSFF